MYPRDFYPAGAYAPAFYPSSRTAGIFYPGAHYAPAYYPSAFYPATRPIFHVPSFPALPSFGQSLYSRPLRCSPLSRPVKCSPTIARPTPCSSQYVAFLAARGERLPSGVDYFCIESCEGPQERLYPSSVYYRHSLAANQNGDCFGGYERISGGGVGLRSYFSHSGDPLFVQRPSYAPDLDRYWRQYPGHATSWLAAPGSVITTLDDFDSLAPYFGQFGFQFGSLGSFTPWDFNVRGVPEYLEDSVGIDGATHAAILRYSFYVDAVNYYFSALSFPLWTVPACCGSDPPSYHVPLYYINRQSEYGRVRGSTIQQFDTTEELQAHIDGLPNTALLQYPFRDPDRFDVCRLGKIEGIDTGGIVEVYFNSHFASPWDGVFPFCTGGHMQYALDPQGVRDIEEYNGGAGPRRLECNATGTLDTGLPVVTQNPLVLQFQATYHLPNLGLSGYGVTSPGCPAGRCNELSELPTLYDADYFLSCEIQVAPIFRPRP